MIRLSPAARADLHDIALCIKADRGPAVAGRILRRITAIDRILHTAMRWPATE